MLVAHPDPGAGRSVESRMEPFVVARWLVENRDPLRTQGQRHTSETGQSEDPPLAEKKGLRLAILPA